jgi:hypothetical protein
MPVSSSLDPIPAPEGDAVEVELNSSNKHNVGFRIRNLLFRLPSPPMDIRDEPPKCRMEDNIGVGMCPPSAAALLPIEDARGQSTIPSLSRS